MLSFHVIKKRKEPVNAVTGV